MIDKIKAAGRDFWVFWTAELAGEYAAHALMSPFGPHVGVAVHGFHGGIQDKKIREFATLGLHGPAQPLRNAPRIMAKKSWIARNERKKQTVEKYAELRLKLKAEKDYVGLSMLPRDASPTRLINRCEITGRRRAFLRRFRLSRITFRELASAGMLPGVTKSSW